MLRQGEAEIAAEAHVTRAAVLHGFQEAIELGRSRSDPGAMIAGWREIAKMCGFYAPERKCVELSTEGLALRTRYEEMSDEELGNLIAAAPAPDADPYVEVGDRVEVGQTVCIVEAMKLMNEIEAEVRGKIVKVLVENTQPVEYGQQLFLLEPV